MKTTFAQTSFLGGEWSPYAQGHFNLETYRTALNVCLNVLPMEVGAAARRPGTILGGTTRNGQPAVLRDFHFANAHPYTLEFTQSHLRLWSGIAIATESLPVGVVSISSANPAVMTVAAATAWAAGDQIILHSDSNAIAPGLAVLFNRPWQVGKTSTTIFTLYDPVTGLGLDGSTLSGALAGGGLIAARVLDYATPYAQSQLQGLRVVQSSATALILHASYKPTAIVTTSAEGGGSFAQFTYQSPVSPSFVDGPYLDPPSVADGTTLTPTGLSGTITLTASATTWINGGAGFKSTDVGRLVRLFSEPALWDVAHNYNKGDVVKYGGTYWTSQGTAGNTGFVPGGDPTSWFINPYGGVWTWGTIATVSSPTVITATLAPVDPNQVQPGGPLLYNVALTTWQLGVFSDTSGWPAGGCYMGGRFWLFGLGAQKFYGSVAEDPNPLNFSPTDFYGNVLDSSGVFETAQADSANSIFWMLPMHDNAIAIGTQEGEFLLQASNLGDPITATSIQCHRGTKYKCANVEPRWTGLSAVFVQAYQRSLYEYVSDVYSKKLTATDLSEKARHLTGPLIQEIAYQYQTIPVVWSRMGDGSLIGCTYKRESPFGNQPPKFVGWHRHQLGSGRNVISIQSGPSPDGTLDTVAMATQDPASGTCYVEFLSPFFDETWNALQANFVDGGGVPSVAQWVAGTPNTVVLYGLNNIAGKTVSVWGAGLDLGDFTVSATGTITLPVDVAGSLFTTALLATLSASGVSYGTLGVAIPGGAGYSANFGAVNELRGTGSSPSLPCDWDNNIGYAIDTGVGVQAVNLNTGAVIGSQYADASATTICARGADGSLFWAQSSANSGTLTKVHTTPAGALSIGSTFGANGSSFSTVATSFGVTGHLLSPYALSCGQAYIDGKLRNYLVSTSLASPSVGSCQIDLMDTDAMNYTGLSANVQVHSSSSTRMNLSRGITVGTGANASLVFYGAAWEYAVGGLGGVDIYKITVTQNPAGGPAFTVTKVGSIAPATIEGDWTSVDSCVGVGYCEEDGNLLIAVGTSTGVTTHGSYLMKVGAGSATILWKMTDATIKGTPDQHWFEKSRFRGSRAAMLVENGSAFGYTLDTFAGTVVASTTMTQFTLTGSTAGNGASGSLAARGNFTASGVSLPLAYQSSPNFTNFWGVFYGASGPGAVPNGNYYAPFAVGFTYTSRGQIVRAVMPEEAGGRIGPALGVKRRNHALAALLQNTQGVSFGTDFTSLVPADFRDATDNPGTVPLSALFSGLHWVDGLNDSDTFDGMLCWQVTRPYPCNVIAIQGFQASKPT